MNSLPAEKILLAVSRYYGLTNRQITRLLFGRSESYVREQTKRLCDDKFLHHTFLPKRVETGRAARVFFLTDKGRSYVQTLGVDLTGLAHHLPSHASIFLRHLESANDVLIACELLTRVEGIELIGFAHERQLRAMRLSAIPDGWVGYDVFGEKVGLAFEVDLGTEMKPYFSQKIEKLMDFAGGEYRLLGLESLTIAVVAEGEARARLLKRWIEETLTRVSRENWADLFRITPMNPALVPAVEFLQGIHWGKPFDLSYHRLVEGGG